MCSSPQRVERGDSADDLPSADIVTVRPAGEVMTRQRLPYFVGISAGTAGSRGLSLNLVHIPPGACARAHSHRGFETAIYLLRGRVETRYGPALAKSVINEAGDFIFIPPGVAHQPRNLSENEPALAVVARNDAGEQENVMVYDAAVEG